MFSSRQVANSALPNLETVLRMGSFLLRSIRGTFLATVGFLGGIMHRQGSAGTARDCIIMLSVIFRRGRLVARIGSSVNE
jgi:hypothetical protein